MSKDVTGSQSVDKAMKLLSLVGRSVERGMSLNEIVEEAVSTKQPPGAYCLP